MVRKLTLKISHIWSPILARHPMHRTLPFKRSSTDSLRQQGRRSDRTSAARKFL